MTSERETENPSQNNRQTEEPGTSQSRFQNIAENFLSQTTASRIVWGSFAMIIISVLIIIVSAFVIQPSQSFTDLLVSILNEVAVAIFISALVTAISRYLIVNNYQRYRTRMETFVEKDFTRLIKDRTEMISEDIEEQTGRLFSAGASLEAMLKAGVSRIYANRDLTRNDIQKDLTDESITKIYLVGISLNDFVQAGGPHNETWKGIQNYIRRGANGRKLEIKIMIVHPYSTGAQLRYLAESRDPHAVGGRLHTDVIQSAQHMLALKKETEDSPEVPSGVSFEIRFFTVSPILFLCHTDHASYIQQYYFWRSRDTKVNTPILRYTKLDDTQGRRSLHEEIEQHFNWIWNEASVPIEDILERGNLGVDKGLDRAGAVNIFNDPVDTKERMLWLLHNAKRKVYIQGVSLHSFFSDGDLYTAIAELAGSDKDLEFKVLLLDPRSNQAYYRSYREYFIRQGTANISFEDYQSAGQYHLNSALYRDTGGSIKSIREIIEEFNQNQTKFQARLYSSAPTCFMLMVDSNVLVEQYHYGKVVPGGRVATILGKDMPVIEYKEEPSGLFKSDELADELRNPYKLLNDHFLHVFEKNSRNIEDLEEPHSSQEAP